MDMEKSKTQKNNNGGGCIEIDIYLWVTSDAKFLGRVGFYVLKICVNATNYDIITKYPDISQEPEQGM